MFMGDYSFAWWYKIKHILKKYYQRPNSRYELVQDKTIMKL